MSTCRKKHRQKISLTATPEWIMKSVSNKKRCKESKKSKRMTTNTEESSLPGFSEGVSQEDNSLLSSTCKIAMLMSMSLSRELWNSKTKEKQRMISRLLKKFSSRLEETRLSKDCGLNKRATVNSKTCSPRSTKGSRPTRLSKSIKEKKGKGYHKSLNQESAPR